MKARCSGLGSFSLDWVTAAYPTDRRGPLQRPFRCGRVTTGIRSALPVPSPDALPLLLQPLRPAPAPAPGPRSDRLLGGVPAFPVAPPPLAPARGRAAIRAEHV